MNTKALLSILFIFVCVISFAQTPNTNTQSNDRTTNEWLGPTASNGYKIKFFPSVATLNAQPYLRGIPGLMVKVGDTLYYRSTDTTRWIPLSYTTISGSYLISTGGISLSDTTVTVSPPINYVRDGVQQEPIVSSGMFAIPKLDSGLQQATLIVITDGDILDTLRGPVDSFNAVSPDLPEGYILVTAVYTNGATVTIGINGGSAGDFWDKSGNVVGTGKSYLGSTDIRTINLIASGQLIGALDSTGRFDFFKTAQLRPLTIGNGVSSNMQRFEAKDNSGNPFYATLQNEFFANANLSALKINAPGYTSINSFSGLLELGGASPSIRGQSSLDLYNTSSSSGISSGNRYYQPSGTAFNTYATTIYGNRKNNSITLPNASTIIGDSVTVGMLSPSALSQWNSTTKGIIIPRMTGVQMNAIATPTTGTLVHCTDSSNSPFCYWTGSGWRKLLSQTGGNATYPGNFNVIIDTIAHTLCIVTDTTSNCYPYTGGITVQGDSVCFDGGDCFLLSGDTIISAGGWDSATIIGDVLCFYSTATPGSSECVTINNSNGFVDNGDLSGDSSAYNFRSGSTLLFSLPTLIRSLYAGSGILINDTTIDGRATTVIYNIGGSGGTPGIDDVLAENQTLTTMRSINAGGFDFNIENADFLNLQATNDITLISYNNGLAFGSKNPTVFSVNNNTGLVIDTAKIILTSVDSTTRVGINTGAPQAALHVRGDGSITAAFMNGNVGIGTTTPTATEHLVGTFRYEDGNEAAGAVLTSDVNGNATWEMPTIDTVPTTHYWGAFGQSNMEEQSPAGDSLYKKDWTPNPQVQVYVSGSWVTANRYTNNIATGAIPVRENSVVVAAQQYLLNHPYDTIRIITSIQSNTALSSWTKPQTGFGEKDTVNTMYYVTNTKLTTQIPAGSYLECIFWQQGEKNEQDTTTNAYMYMMKALDSTYKVYSTVSPNLRQIFAYPTTTYPAMRAVFDSVRRNVIDLTGHDFGVVTHDYSAGVDATHLNGYQTAMVGMAFNINFQYRYTNLTNIPWAVRPGSANGDTAISIKPVVSNASAVSVTFGNGTTRFVNKPVEMQVNTLFTQAVTVNSSTAVKIANTSTTGGQAEVSTTSSTGGAYSAWKCKQGVNSTFNLSMFSGMLNTAANGGHASLWTSVNGTYIERLRAVDSGRIGIGLTTPTAALHLKAGTAAAWTGPLKFESGTNLTTPENGAVEYNGTDYFATSGGVRYTLQRVTTVPASAGATGVTGSIAYDSSFIYVCVATNTWVRAALATW